MTYDRRLLRIGQDSSRTAIAAVASLLLSRWCGLPESYWAPITTLIIMQSTLGSALTVSGQRIVGTAMGATAAIAITAAFPANALTFGVGVFLVGLVCSLLHLGRPAIRFSGVTLAIIMLIARKQSYWVIAGHRFIEVAVGIVAGLLVTAIWPQEDSEKQIEVPKKDQLPQ